MLVIEARVKLYPLSHIRLRCAYSPFPLVIVSKLFQALNFVSPVGFYFYVLF